MTVKSFSAGVWLSLRPAVEIVGIFEPEHQERRNIDRYRLDLAKDDLIVDGEDRAKVILYARIKPAGSDNKNDRAREAIKLFQLTGVSLAGTGTSAFELLEEPDDKEFNRNKDNAGCKRLTVRARERTPAYFTPANSTTGIFLQCEGVINPPPELKAAGRSRIPVQGCVPINARFFWLRLWVCPSLNRGYSQARAYACLASSGQGADALAMLPLELAVTRQGGNGQRLEITDPQTGQTDAGGWSSWQCRYSGINWQNLTTTEFTLQCRITGTRSAVPFHIHVGHNFRRFLEAVRDNANALQLNNGEWDDPQTRAFMVDYVVHDSCRGPLYNFRDLAFTMLQAVHAQTFDPLAAFPADHNQFYQNETIEMRLIHTLGDHAHRLSDVERPAWTMLYLCSDIAGRIINFGMGQRFGQHNPESAMRMNGIEFASYQLSILGYYGLHNMFGIHPSGTDVAEDPRFIDPWWNQRFDDKVVLTWREEEVKTAAFIAYMLCMTGLVIIFLRSSLLRIGFNREIVGALIRVFQTELPQIIRAWLSGRRPAEILGFLASREGSTRVAAYSSAGLIVQRGLNLGDRNLQGEQCEVYVPDATVRAGEAAFRDALLQSEQQHGASPPMTDLVNWEGDGR